MDEHKIPSADEVMGKKHPLAKFRAGSISATIWENIGKNDKGETVSYRTVSFGRGYKDANGNWQTTTSLRLQDLPKASLVLSKAYEYLVLDEDDQKDEQTTLVQS
ncbi:MAG: hypothetical protein H6502_01535 [Candidatus Woesearchaeota archaeon]|nr:MAG: hypothetical protein H6502_01535 [Candidatus Woesearchaeota archaeon]